MINPISLIIPFIIILPNVVFSILNFNNLATSKNETKLNFLTMIERIGQISVFTIPVIYPLRIKDIVDVVALYGMIFMVIFYYVGWIRYFFHQREYKFLFLPLFRIPVPMAISPVFYFLFASLILHSLILFIATLIFGISHIIISLQEYNIIRNI